MSLVGQAGVDGAYAVLVVTPKGRTTRRIFLSLHSATAAVARAHDRGQEASLVLCQLTAVGELG